MNNSPAPVALAPTIVQFPADRSVLDLVVRGREVRPSLMAAQNSAAWRLSPAFQVS